MKPNLESIKEDIQKTKRPLIAIIIFSNRASHFHACANRNLEPPILGMITLPNKVIRVLV